jgi:uncharacterized membrane protein YuzA (DUF378 family)
VGVAAYDLVHAIKGVHITYAVLGFSMALASGVNEYEEER